MGLTMDDITLNKLASIKRCLARIREEFTNESEFKKNYTKQDSVILNLQRACEACIDICNHIIRKNNLGIPQSSRNSFELVAQSQFIDQGIAERLKKMVGLRNIAVHDYQTLNIDIVIAVITKHLVDFEVFSQVISRSMGSDQQDQSH
jgi:uncharacterized protein YutE (UPF0331/DUF86 family)